MIPTCWYPKRESKREKNARKTRENVSILHYALDKNASQLHFGRVLVAFWSRFGHKPDQTANPTHIVIWPYHGSQYVLHQLLGGVKPSIIRSCELLYRTTGFLTPLEGLIVLGKMYVFYLKAETFFHLIKKQGTEMKFRQEITLS